MALRESARRESSGENPRGRGYGSLLLQQPDFAIVFFSAGMEGDAGKIADGHFLGDGFYDGVGLTERIKVFPEGFGKIIHHIVGHGGIGEEEHAAVFGRFYRGNAVAEKSGVGIGLYLARSIMQQQGGYIRLSSTQGEGSTFGLYFPTAIVSKL